MDILFLILLLLAVTFFVLAAFGISGRRVNLLALGLALWVTVDLIRLLQKL